MKMPTLRTATIALGALALLACSSTSHRAVPVDGGPRDLKQSARELFAQYEDAIVRQRREAIAGFYDYRGVVRVLNGTTRRLSRAQLDTIYRTSWTPPAFFTFDSLAYDSIAPGQVLVTGGFRWARAGAHDTARFIYAALLQAVDSGMAIRFEHETARPPR